MNYEDGANALSPRNGNPLSPSHNSLSPVQKKGKAATQVGGAASRNTPSGLDNTALIRLNGVSRTVGQQHDSNCEAIKTAIRSFARFVDVDAIPGSAAAAFWTTVLSQGTEALIGMLPGGKLYSVFAAGYKASKDANASKSEWNGALAKAEYVQGLVDYWEGFRSQTETYWNGEGSRGTQALINQTEAQPAEKRNLYINELVAQAEFFNKRNVDAVSFEKGLYTHWMHHNTNRTSRWTNTGTIDVVYHLDKDTRGFSLHSAELVGPGSGGIVRRMQSVAGNMQRVADFPFRKRVFFREFDRGLLGDTLVNYNGSVYGEQNELVDPLTFGPLLGSFPEYGLDSLGMLPLSWHQITSSD